MPKQYTAMRDKFAKSMSLKKAKTKAARIYNAKHKTKVSRKPHPKGRYR